ncbi:DUF4188 domain-containing protein [Pseudanabaena sp. PCC 6802]|uniref:DUF4188 domain-containing protein n=1 Tax=Pseudanabaena sp. PCC 6802 TaxID=118173 RepID=UPI0003809F44|nr:DUF4188 domain-containing protein [Pseudanabaena sp. PCC 6802]
MSRVFPGRFTAQMDESFVVFLIGMRVNKFWSFSKWLPVASAMSPMLATLYEHPEKGFLGGENFFRFAPVTTLLLSYWRSFEDLERFARSPSEPHLAAWQKFNRAVGSDGSVGIWHETYLIQPGQYEAIYGNMPAFGLAAATNHVPATGKRETARCRLGGENEPAVPSP